VIGVFIGESWSEKEVESDKGDDAETGPDEYGGKDAHGVVSLRRVRRAGLLAASMRSEAALAYAADAVGEAFL
jgi:hypothetical protein